MPSSLWAQGAKIWCNNVSLRATFTGSFPTSRRRLMTGSAKLRSAPQSQSPCHSRHESSLAAKSEQIQERLELNTPTVPSDISPRTQPAKIESNAEYPEFSTLKGTVSYETLKAITVSPFKLTHMSAVQAEVLPLLPHLAQPYSPDPPEAGFSRHPRDLLVKARTGTGKTLAFLVPAIEARLKSIEAYAKQAVRDSGLTSDKHLESRAKRAFAREQVGTLIISPTRELATQIANEAIKLTHHHEGFEVRLFVGGMSKRMQMRDWMKGRRDIVVGTPGRLRDLLMSQPEVTKSIEKTKLLVLDEADTLLDMGFRDDIEAITKYLPPTPQRQTFLFSATVSRAIQQVARATLDKNHLFINTVSESTSPVHAHVPQYHTVLPTAGHQIPHVLRLLAHDQLSNPGSSKAIVFFPTTKMTQLFSTILLELSKTTLPAGMRSRVYELHSKRSQEARNRTSDAFRQDQSGAAILVTSDVSARGVDYPGVTRVIQVGIPASSDQYIHRVGRTGRAGTNGRGDLVLLPWEIGFVTWELNQVPLRPLTVNELQSQVEELSARHDADPAAFLQGVKLSQSSDRRGRPIRASGQLFPSQVSPVVNDVTNSIAGLLENIDEEAVKETFASLLGYYLSKSQELRTQKEAILDGCKNWSMEALGLSVPPYISPLFLQKLGLFDSRTKHFGKGRSRESGYGMQNQRPNRYGSQRYERRNDGEIAEGSGFGNGASRSFGARTRSDDGFVRRDFRWRSQ